MSIQSRLTGIEGLVDKILEGLLKQGKADAYDFERVLRRGMDAQVRRLPGKLLCVPNLYHLCLQQAIFDYYAPVCHRLENALTQLLEKYAKEKGYVTEGPIEVHVVAAEASQKESLQVKAEFDSRTRMVPETERVPLYTEKLSLQGAHRLHTMKDNVLRIGRDDSNELRLSDASVSRKHAEIKREGGEFFLTDVGSLNGTYHNRARLSKAHEVSTPVKLHDGDMLKFGGTKQEKFIVRIEKGY